MSDAVEKNIIDKNNSIFVADSNKPLGLAIINQLENQGYHNIIGVGNDQPNLTNQQAVNSWFSKYNPDYVILAVGKSGGITANQNQPATLFFDNIISEVNLIDAACRFKTKKLLYLASSCIYPKFSKQPISEKALMTDKLELTNEAYATAKLAGVVMCQAYRKEYKIDFISAVPTNYFSANDGFSIESSHVITALIAKIHIAKDNGDKCVTVLGSGKPIREFLYIDDIAKASVFLFENYSSSDLINIAGGITISIKELACQLKEIIGYQGELFFDTNYPDGMPVKTLDSEKIKSMGWTPVTNFNEALVKTYNGYLRSITAIS